MYLFAKKCAYLLKRFNPSQPAQSVNNSQPKKDVLVGLQRYSDDTL